MCEFKSVASHCKFTSLLNMHDIRRNVKGKEKKIRYLVMLKHDFNFTF